MKIFCSNYHISVNSCFVEDLAAIGLEVLMPSIEFANGRLDFFAANDEHSHIAKIIEYEDFIQMEPMVLVLNCSQLFKDMMRLYRDRGERDVLILLSSQLGLGEWLPFETDYLISHSLNFHRKTKALYKTLYFNRPKILLPPKTDDEVRQSFEDKKIKLYINHFETQLAHSPSDNFKAERANAENFRQQWLDQTGWNIPFYGFENADGYLSMGQVQEEMKDSMFTLVFKGHETWGQMVNESFLLGTPGIFLEQHIVDMFTEYLVNPDTSIISDRVDDLILQINKLSFEQYATLAAEAKFQSEMYCNDIARRSKLRWFFDQVAKDNKILAK